MARTLRNDDDGQDWQRRPVRGPSSALSFDRKDPTGAGREKTASAALAAIW